LVRGARPFSGAGTLAGFASYDNCFLSKAATVPCHLGAAIGELPGLGYC